MQAAESEQSIGSDFIAEENLHFEENNDDDENSSYDEDTGDDSDEMSEYEESISFHNACREFYMNRKDATESFKHNMERDHEKRTEVERRKKTTSIDDAMERLRREMASLMDQDLTLMEQLMTLNETIEDIKVKRLYGSSRESFHSSCDIKIGSNWSLPERKTYFRASKIYPGKATVDMTSTENLTHCDKSQRQVDPEYNAF